MRKLELFCCFVDFRKAFDSVWRDAMFLNLTRLNIGGKFYELVKHMYSETKSCGKLPGGLTDLYTTSPILFNMFIDSVVDIFCPLECAAVMLDDILLNCLIYADDVLLISSTALGLQNSMNRLNSYCNKWALEIT